MELDSKKMKDKALTTVSKLKANIKGTYYNMAEIPSSSVQQLAEFIQKYPDTHVSKKILLGNTYNFFRLNMNDYHFYLEISNARILQLDGSLNGKKLVSYRSYRDYNDLNSPIKLS
ncbi:MAG: hypothetical protein ACQEWI_12635 [Bacillota bacterium]